MASGNSETSSESDVTSTKEFLAMAAAKMEWGDLSDVEMVMDIGCGTGCSSNEILNIFPDVKQIIAFDKDPQYIEEAIRENGRDNIQYFTADVQIRFTLSRWLGKMNRVFSIFCFTFVIDQNRALHNIYQLLKPGGGAALIFLYDYPIYLCLKQMYQSPDWQNHEFMPNLLSIYPDEDNAIQYPDFKDCLLNIGFEIILCEKTDKFSIFLTEKEFKDTLNGFLDSYIMPYVPDDLAEDFRRDYFIEFVEQNGKTSDEEFVIRHCFVKILVRRS